MHQHPRRKASRLSNCLAVEQLLQLLVWEAEACIGARELADVVGCEDCGLALCLLSNSLKQAGRL
jgi:hypothetical protein